MISKDLAIGEPKANKAIEILDEMQSYLNSARYALFSNREIMVDRVRMEEFMQELRQCINAEVSGTADASEENRKRG